MRFIGASLVNVAKSLRQYCWHNCTPISKSIYVSEYFERHLGILEELSF